MPSRCCCCFSCFFLKVKPFLISIIWFYVNILNVKYQTFLQKKYCGVKELLWLFFFSSHFPQRCTFEKNWNHYSCLTNVIRWVHNISHKQKWSCILPLDWKKICSTYLWACDSKSSHLKHPQCWATTVYIIRQVNLQMTAVMKESGSLVFTLQSPVVAHQQRDSKSVCLHLKCEFVSGFSKQSWNPRDVRLSCIS